MSLSIHSKNLPLPLKPDSVRFAVIGDMGTGDKPQYEVAGQMIKDRLKFPFEFVIALGDNLYGGSDPSDYESKFERPYKLLLDAGVIFYAVLGNHDSPNERFYQSFNMNGQKYYTCKKGNVRFFPFQWRRRICTRDVRSLSVRSSGRLSWSLSAQAVSISPINLS